MRRPGLTKQFAYRGQKGLSTILRDKRSFDDCFAENIISTEMELLDVMPSGPRPMNPVELLGDARMSELLAWAESRYDRILIDAPPALAVADPAVIGRMVDGSILTVRPDRNRKYMVKRAAESLTSLGANILGMVVNQLPPNSDEYGYGYGYGYGYSYGHDQASAHEDNHTHDENHEPDVEIKPIRKHIVHDDHTDTPMTSNSGKTDFSKPLSVAEYEDYYRRLADQHKKAA
jgi:capsular exopolysaccharide synthesis family protein